ncbi:MAG: hypothetical protein IAE93_01780 [Ignavibacteria bacterium]|nr:hypothetical protein [Ignavibacteria bacterium]
MQNSKFISNLKLLDRKQLEEFDKFMNSPFFLKRNSLPAVFYRIKKFYPQYNMTKQEIYSAVYQGKPYNDVLMRKYLSEMNNMLNDYLAISSFMKDKMTFRSKLVDRQIELRSFEEAARTAENMLNELESSVYRNEKYYYNKYIFERYSKTISNLITNLNPDTDWKQAMDGFVNYSALTMLQFYYIILNDNRFRSEKSNIDLGILDDLIKVFEKSVIPQNPAANIFYNLVKSFMFPENETYYTNIKLMLAKHNSLLDANELAAIYTYLHNYCFVKVDSGDLNFLKERFEIVNKVLENGFHLKDGYFVPDMFVSMTNNALMLREFDWAEDFIKRYKDDLPEAEKSAYENLANSALFMFKGDYEKALKHLSRVKFKKYYDKFKIKSLNLMICYEAGYFEQAFSQADSFRHFISKYKTITPYFRERTNNFLKQLLQLMRYRLKEVRNPETDDFSRKPAMYRPWLLQKIAESKLTNGANS